jgi:hypothetical protein
MPLLHILLTLIVVGILLWLVNSFIPMAGSIKSISNAVAVICVVAAEHFWSLSFSLPDPAWVVNEAG